MIACDVILLGCVTSYNIPHKSLALPAQVAVQPLATKPYRVALYVSLPAQHSVSHEGHPHTFMVASSSAMNCYELISIRLAARWPQLQHAVQGVHKQASKFPPNSRETRRHGCDKRVVHTEGNNGW